jgi:hypothetical protein
MNINLNETSSASQCVMLLELLFMGAKITDNGAREYLDCTRIAARVYELKRRGFPIMTTIIKTSTNKRIAQYYIP